MAKVVFTAVVADIKGKLAGSVFQRSFGGAQLRTKVSPGNPQSIPQQQLRVNMASLSTLWGELSNAQRTTWYNGAGGTPFGFNMYVKRNQVLFLAGLPLISTFVRGKPPLNLTQAQNGTVTIPFSVPILVNVDSAPSGYTQVNRWSKWVPPGRSFITKTQYVLTPDNFSWDADASGYNFDPAAPDFPPGSGWKTRLAYGAVENASGVLSLSNFLEFSNP
jgi:hypothetical protein